VSDEIDHGLIPDDLAWNLALDEATQVVGPFQVIHARGDAGGRPRAVARSGQIGMYVRAFADGKGENGLHSHPTDAIWIVLEGAATFHGLNETLLGELTAKEGILVPAGESYRFRCNGPSVLARISVADTDAHGDEAPVTGAN
jgi:mannose-6-phosphate isomerase-like protein (cupin superfamily)